MCDRGDKFECQATQQKIPISWFSSNGDYRGFRLVCKTLHIFYSSIISLILYVICFFLQCATNGGTQGFLLDAHSESPIIREVDRSMGPQPAAPGSVSCAAQSALLVSFKPVTDRMPSSKRIEANHLQTFAKKHRKKYDGYNVENNFAYLRSGITCEQSRTKNTPAIW